MNTSRKRELTAAAIGSTMLLTPFVVLELVNNGNFSRNFPWVLFAAMWVLACLFVLAVMPVVRNLREGSAGVPNINWRLSRLVLSLIIAWFWMRIVLDQMPCFLGVPNCD